MASFQIAANGEGTGSDASGQVRRCKELKGEKARNDSFQVIIESGKHN